MRFWTLGISALLAVTTLGSTAVAGRTSESSTQTGARNATVPHAALRVGQTITINGKGYLVVQLLDALRYVPNSTIRTMGALVRQCRAARSFGLVAFRPRLEVSVAAWLPRDPLRCWSGDTVTGGGPGGSQSGACLQGFRTSDYFVVFAGTTVVACTHMAIQVPGGFAATTTASSADGGLPANSGIRVKCQTWHQGRLWDFVALPTTVDKLPLTRTGWWIQDRYVPTNYDEIPNVPRCDGVNLF